MDMGRKENERKSDEGIMNFEINIFDAQNDKTYCLGDNGTAMQLYPSV
jgi:hypothetical protein